jgi:soluble lytic murein transglycosylase-like protein
MLTAIGAVAAVGLAGSADTGTHTVRTGETLSEIAAANGTTVQALTSANGISDPHVIMVGRVLALPAAGKAGAPAAAPAATSYKIQAGDNLASIAARFGTSAAALARTNGITNPHLIVMGAVLSIPAPSPSPTLPERLRSSPDRMALRPTFERWAARYGTPSDLLQALCWMESGWRNGVVSSTGAVGIGQLMPTTVDFIRAMLGNRSLNPNVPDDNIRMSAWFLTYLLRQTGGNVELAVAAYYQGLRSVTTRPLFAETVHYVSVVVALRPQFG